MEVKENQGGACHLSQQHWALTVTTLGAAGTILLAQASSSPSRSDAAEAPLQISVQRMQKNHWLIKEVIQVMKVLLMPSL